jgi:rhodanese-related sulfurtransferase
VSAVISDPTPVPVIDPVEAQRLARAGAFVLDVREDDEWEAGHSPEAVHMAMGSVAERIDEIPSDRTLVCVCRVGARSGAVAGALADAGYDVRNVEGGMLAWEAAGLTVLTDAGDTGRII